MESTRKSNKILILIFNISLIGIALGSIIGSLLKITESQNAISNSSKKEVLASINLKHIGENNSLAIDSLNRRWETIAKKNKDLKTSAFIFLIDKNKYAEIASNEIFPAYFFN